MIRTSPNSNGYLVMTEDARFFFIIGNKRSGTSFLTHVLNAQKNIFLGYETDILWILYQFHNQILPFKKHPLDGPKGLEYTLENFGNLLDIDKSPKENFIGVQTAIMKNGSPWLPPIDRAPKWIGDTKPVQNMQSDIFEFANQNLPNAKFIHIVRSPYGYFRSFSVKLKESTQMDATLDYWAENELRVIRLKEMGHPILTVLYKDLCNEMQRTCDTIFAFLEEEGVGDIQSLVESISGINATFATNLVRTADKT